MGHEGFIYAAFEIGQNEGAFENRIVCLHLIRTCLHATDCFLPVSQFNLPTGPGVFHVEMEMPLNKRSLV